MKTTKSFFFKAQFSNSIFQMFRKSINKLVVINQCSKTSLNSCRRRQQMPTLNLTQQRSFADGASPVSGKFRKKDKGKKGKTDDEDGDRVAFAKYID